jgi:hypothetical protein
LIRGSGRSLAFGDAAMGAQGVAAEGGVVHLQESSGSSGLLAGSLNTLAGVDRRDRDHSQCDHWADQRKES